MISHPQRPIGIYLHIPFCAQKCPYCDFYSVTRRDLAKQGDADAVSHYIDALIRCMRACQGDRLTADTVYFGGGTPSLIGAENLARILDAVRDIFSVTADAEISCEVNPESLPADFFPRLYAAGFNRLSLGMQSADALELHRLGRRHSAEQVKSTVLSAAQAGFENISLDLMLGVPESSAERLRSSIALIGELPVRHVSAYMLKLEEGTPFYAGKSKLNLPDDDGMADLYELCTEELSKLGFTQYEISNYAKRGSDGQLAVSKHNCKYWRCEEYLGFGPSAHSFYQGRRFYYPRSMQAFLAGEPPVADGEGGDFEEFVMLGLRLHEGISRADCENRFEGGGEAYRKLLQNTKKCPPDLLQADKDHIALTAKGFAVSNAVILALLS